MSIGVSNRAPLVRMLPSFTRTASSAVWPSAVVRHDGLYPYGAYRCGILDKRTSSVALTYVPLPPLPSRIKFSITDECVCIVLKSGCPCHLPHHNADLYFAGPRAAEAHLGTAGCHVRFLNFPRRRGCLSDQRRILRSYFTMPSSIASMVKQKPRNSSCVSIRVSIKTGNSLHYWLKEAPTDGDRRCRIPAG